MGAVERSKLIDGAAIEAGDILIGLASSGLHSNGFSLARHILFDIACLSLSDEPVELGRPLADELLEPTRIYVKSILDLAKSVEIRGGLAHITGGGLVDNPEDAATGPGDPARPGIVAGPSNLRSSTKAWQCRGS